MPGRSVGRSVGTDSFFFRPGATHIQATPSISISSIHLDLIHPPIDVLCLLLCFDSR